VDLLKFGTTGDTRPQACEDTAGYPTSIISGIVDQIRQAGAEFAIDLGDHMYVCNNDLSIATAQMNLYMQAAARLGQTFFMTEGNHECYHSPCPLGSTNANFVAFMKALAPLATKPYYSFDVQTSPGLASFVVVADNSWDSAQQTWLDQTLATADTKAAYTIIAKHHPQGDSSIPENATIMTVIRKHKFALLMTGHNHYYKHEQKADGGRDMILGTGGAPLIAGGSFYGWALVEQQRNGQLQISVYDTSSNTPVDTWSVSKNP
jgi:hypothetical protein